MNHSAEPYIYCPPCDKHFPPEPAHICPSKGVVCHICDQTYLTSEWDSCPSCFPASKPTPEWTNQYTKPDDLHTCSDCGVVFAGLWKNHICEIPTYKLLCTACAKIFPKHDPNYPGPRTHCNCGKALVEVTAVGAPIEKTGQPVKEFHEKIGSIFIPRPHQEPLFTVAPFHHVWVVEQRVMCFLAGPVTRQDWSEWMKLIRRGHVKPWYMTEGGAQRALKNYLRSNPLRVPGQYEYRVVWQHRNDPPTPWKPPQRRFKPRAVKPS